MITYKKQIIILLTLFATLIAVVGCNKQYFVFCRSYIQAYSHTAGVEATVFRYYEADSLIRVESVIDYEVSMFSEGEDKIEYDRLCEQNNDMTYNREETFYLDINPQILCLYPDVVAVNVVSDTDFDAQHPAGTSLNDCVSLEIESYSEFIDSGYEGYPHSTSTNAVLSEYIADDFRLKTRGPFIFRFVKSPDVSTTHTLTFAFTYADGNTYTAQCKFQF